MKIRTQHNTDANGGSHADKMLTQQHNLASSRFGQGERYRQPPARARAHLCRQVRRNVWLLSSGPTSLTARRHTHRGNFKVCFFERHSPTFRHNEPGSPRSVVSRALLVLVGLRLFGCRRHGKSVRYGRKYEMTSEVFSE